MNKITLLVVVGLVLGVLVGCPSPSGSGNTSTPNQGGSSGHDGSSSSPVQLSVGQAFSGKIGASNTADWSSYYRFNTASISNFELILTQDSVAHPINGAMKQLSVELIDETNSSNNRMGYILADGLRPVFENLAPARNYTIVISNYQAAGTYQLKVSPYTNPNVGSQTSPMTLELGSPPHHGTASNAASASSYFTFITGNNNTSVTFNYDVYGLSLVLYNSTAFDLNHWVGASNTNNNGVWTLAGLQPNTTYYLQLRPGSGLGGSYAHSVDYTLTTTLAP